MIMKTISGLGAEAMIMKTISDLGAEAMSGDENEDNLRSWCRSDERKERMWIEVRKAAAFNYVKIPIVGITL